MRHAVNWQPVNPAKLPGGTVRDVPACALDAERVRAGADPDIRKVLALLPGPPSEMKPMFEAIVRSVDNDLAKLELTQDYRSDRHAVWGITARNREQNLALNLLLERYNLGYTIQDEVLKITSRMRKSSTPRLASIVAPPTCRTARPA